MRNSSVRSRAGRLLLATTAVVFTALVLAIPASASHGDATLAGSNFEIDTNANLKVDHAAPSIDWASVTESRRNDVATGTSDDSYSGGSKEDDACPTAGTGSIPNNKSDLLTFGAYVESGATADDPGFLNLFWTRVQEPSGTTLMDFELNKSSTDCGNGVNPVRTVGDLLIEYRLEQGGATATIKVREWTGSAWGPATDLTGTAAAGTINTTTIPVAESDGLATVNPLSARTFGEAQLDLSFILDEDKCESFGSAFLKSRASDSFTSQLKDFIKPTPVNIRNCGKVVIHKDTDPEEEPPSTIFDYDHNLQTDPAQLDDPATPNINEATEFQLKDDGTKTFDGVLFGTGYTVTEDDLPTGWDFVGIDCSASAGVTVQVNGLTRTATFDIDHPDDVAECTFTNRARGTIIVEKITNDGSGSFEFTSSTLTSPFTLTTTSAGAGGKDSETFGDLAPGTYDVAETVPDGWNLVASSCSDGSDPATIGLSAGETVTCTFHDAREKGAIEITKTRKHAAADGTGPVPHPDVTFTITGGELPDAGVEVTTDDDGKACLDGLVLSSFVGGYTVTETVPAGYTADGDTSKPVSVTAEATCAAGEKAGVAFGNTPLTDITVSVNSQVPGGTASTITCGTDTADTGPDGDGSLTLSDKEPATYTCTILVDP